MKWRIEFYSEELKQEILSFPPKIVAKTIHVFEMIEEFGANLGEPLTSHLKNELFEIRIKAKEGIARYIYCYQKNRSIIILHAFIKKTQKIPGKELKIALKRKEEVCNETNI